MYTYKISLELCRSILSILFFRNHFFWLKQSRSECEKTLSSKKRNFHKNISLCIVTMYVNWYKAESFYISNKISKVWKWDDWRATSWSEEYAYLVRDMNHLIRIFQTKNGILTILWYYNQFSVTKTKEKICWNEIKVTNRDICSRLLFLFSMKSWFGNHNKPFQITNIFDYFWTKAIKQMIRHQNDNDMILK